eukprot:jgi/Chlat1/4198/Chrsp27S04288
MDNQILKAIIPSVVELIGIVQAFKVVRKCVTINFTDDCKRCFANGKVVCVACRGLGYLRTAPKMMNSMGQEIEDDENIRSCNLCELQGTVDCPQCKGKLYTPQLLPNLHKSFQWQTPWQEQLKRVLSRRSRVRQNRAYRGITTGGPSAVSGFSLDGISGGFKVTGNANLLPPEE